MDKASDFESEECRFESCHDRVEYICMYFFGHIWEHTHVRCQGVVVETHEIVIFHLKKLVSFMVAKQDFYMWMNQSTKRYKLNASRSRETEHW